MSKLFRYVILFGGPVFVGAINLAGFALLGLAAFAVAGLPVALLVLAGMLFGTRHAVPTGPLGMACFVVGVAWLEWIVRKTRGFAAHRISFGWWNLREA